MPQGSKLQPLPTLGLSIKGRVNPKLYIFQEYFFSSVSGTGEDRIFRLLASSMRSESKGSPRLQGRSGSGDAQSCLLAELW